MLRPDDIRSTAFKKGLFGYKAADVDSFKDTVFRAYSDLSKDYEETKDKFDKLTKAMEDTRLKLFELENKLQQAENVSTDAGESVEAKKRDVYKRQGRTVFQPVQGIGPTELSYARQTGRTCIPQGRL